VIQPPLRPSPALVMDDHGGGRRPRRTRERYWSLVS
jgi:hypothetical protein